MGLETKCTLRLAGRSVAGRAHLAADQLTFRGGTRLDLRLANVKSVAVRPGSRLEVSHAGGTLALVMADRATAEKWALKIRYPKSLIDKLGVKPDSQVAVLGVVDEEFARQLRARLKKAPGRLEAHALDFIFHAADSAAELAELARLKPHLRPAGAVWVVSRKGAAATIKDSDVMQAARAAGLVDTKVCGFSATHTALKLVIPRAGR